MVFSSTIFLFLFLPLTLVGYHLLPRRARNTWLLTASLVFYAWGESVYVVLMLLSIAMNWAFGLLVQARLDGDRSPRGVVAAAVAANLALLGWFKYANFLAANWNHVAGLAGLPPLALAPVHLPIGISFFTFQALSYVIDVSRGDGGVQRNPLRLGLYITLFPQLIAGPIVRYLDVASQLDERQVDLVDIGVGAERFIIGLAKKVLLANTVAVVADKVMALPVEQVSPKLAWLAIACYALQIYFDFSGYSDMAIGLGRMFGFHFLENFRYPYVAQSIQEFWRRWHISLSSWYRDYLYIPLGGNRGGPVRTYLNLVVVFFLCGLWHGTSWSFVVWGLFHGSFLCLERVGLARVVAALPRPLRHAYAMLVVLVGWVLFRCETLSQALGLLACMFGLAPASPGALRTGAFLDGKLRVALLVGVVACTPILPALRRWWAARRPEPGLLDHLGAGAVLGLYLLSVVVLSTATYNPFIYFRF